MYILQYFYKPLASGEATYLQIIKQFKLLLLQKIVQDGDEMPSRRMLAVRMGVNPMTVQKAFAELETIGLLNTPHGKASVVQISEEQMRILRGELLEREITGVVAMAKTIGVTANDLSKMINDAYGGFQL